MLWLGLAGIRQLQLMLLKIALLLGVEFHVNVEFVKLVEPPEDQENEGETDGPRSRPNVLTTRCRSHRASRKFGHTLLIVYYCRFTHSRKVIKTLK